MGKSLKVVLPVVVGDAHWASQNKNLKFVIE